MIRLNSNVTGKSICVNTIGEQKNEPFMYALRYVLYKQWLLYTDIMIEIHSNCITKHYPWWYCLHMIVTVTRIDIGCDWFAEL